MTQSSGHVRVERADGVWRVWIDRPRVRNAMALQTVTELRATFEAAAARDSGARVVVVRGTGGHFCAGGDIKDMAAARARPPQSGQPDAMAQVNRQFGRLLVQVDRAPQAVVAVCEGAVFGGGFGLACVADVTLTRADATFGLPETALGVVPAQIAPFLVHRVGRAHARRLAVTGGRLSGEAARAIGLVHETAADSDSLEELLANTLDQILSCAPRAIAVTKGLVNDVGEVPVELLLDQAADAFAAAARGPEGVEGMTAFLGKRSPSWQTSTRAPETSP